MSTTSGSLAMTNRLAGKALIVGVVLLLAGILFTPGGPIIDSVDQTDFVAAINALADNSPLSHTMTLLMIFGVLLMAFGVMPLFRLTGGQRTMAGLALWTGLLGMIIAWSVFIIQIATNHMVVHIMDTGVGSGTGAGQQAMLQDLALAVYSVGGTLHIAFLSISCLASILLGLGIVSRFAEMNLFKAAAYGLVLVGILLLLNLLVIQHFDIELSVLILISSGSLFLGLVCYFVLGIALFQGREELLPDDA